MLFKVYLAVVQRRHLESAVAEQLEEQSNEPNGNGREERIIGGPAETKQV